MGRKVVGAILIGIAVLGIVGTLPDIGESLPPAIIFSVVGLFLMLTKGKGKHKSTPFYNPYVDVSLYDNGDDFPVVNYTGCNLGFDEHIIYATPAQTFTEREQVVGYTGGSSGMSVRVAKGVTLRSGRSKGRAVRGNVRKYNNGDYIVTNKRVIFIGQNDSFELKIDKITVAKPLSYNSFALLSSNRSKNILVDASQAKYALGLLTYVMGQTPVK